MTEQGKSRKRKRSDSDDEDGADSATRPSKVARSCSSDTLASAADEQLPHHACDAGRSDCKPSAYHEDAGAKTVPTASSSSPQQDVLLRLQQKLGLPDTVLAAAQHLWDSLKKGGYVQRIRNPDAIKVVLMRLASQRNATPRPDGDWFHFGSVELGEVTKAMKRLVECKFNLEFDRPRVTHAFVDAFLTRHLQREPRTYMELQLADNAKRLCTDYLNAQSCDKSNRSKREDAIAAASLALAAANSNSDLNGTSNTLGLAAIERVTGIGMQSLTTCLKELQAATALKSKVQ
jgi:hypothetical protein